MASSHSSACCLRILSQRFCHNYFEDHNLIEGSVLGPHYFRTITSFKDLFSLLEPLLMIGSRLLPPDVECSFGRCRHSSQVSTLSIDRSRPYLSTGLDLIYRQVSTLFVDRSRPYSSTSLDLIYRQVSTLFTKFRDLLTLTLLMIQIHICIAERMSNAWVYDGVYPLTGPYRTAAPIPCLHARPYTCLCTCPHTQGPCACLWGFFFRSGSFAGWRVAGVA